MKNNIPLLSVILPAYNVEKYIGQCIDSILAQTFVDFELIIADDGSSDDTRKIIDTYKDSRIIISHNLENLGKTQTVNRLYLLTKGKYITVHDSDDWSDLKRFEKQIDWLEENEDHIMCGTGFRSYDTNLNVIEVFKALIDYNDLVKAIKKSGQFHGPTMLFRKDTITDDFLYRPYFKDNYEDTDLAYRLFQKGICTNINESLYFYRILSTSLCRKEFTIKNSHQYKVVVHLAEQREEYGIDDLMKGDIQAVEKYFEHITDHYAEDKGLIFREGAAYYMYWKYYKKAIGYSLKSIKVDPLNQRSWRTLFYCLRRSILQ